MTYLKQEVLVQARLKNLSPTALRLYIKVQILEK